MLLFWLQSIILSGLFTLHIVLEMKNPIKGIMSYPPAIRKRVESLPQYQGTIGAEKREHMAKKLVSVFVFAVLFAVVCWFSGANTFTSAFLHSFGLFAVVNLWDLLVLDLLWFCHSKRVRLPGTEDMVKEYTSPWHHVLGFGMGLAIGAVVSLLAGGLVALIAHLAS